MNEKQLSEYAFRQGLLLAARAAGAPSTFVAEGKKWNEAFEALASFLTENPGPLGSWVSSLRRDPIFGHWPEAERLLLQGEHDLLLGLFSPAYSRAAFLVKPISAKKELNQFLDEFSATSDERSWLESAGKVFAQKLSAV